MIRLETILSERSLKLIVAYGTIALMCAVASCSNVEPSSGNQPPAAYGENSTVGSGTSSQSGDATANGVAPDAAKDPVPATPESASSDSKIAGAPPTDKPAADATTDPLTVPPTKSILEAAAAVPPVKAVPAGVGLRNFRELPATFAALTEVTTPSAALNTVLAEALPSLAKTNDILNFGSSVEAAAFKMAAGYCSDLVNATSLVQARTRIFGGVDVARAPTTEMTATKIEALSTALIDNFWNRSRETLPDPAEAKKVLASLAMKLLAGEVQTNAATTKKVVTGMCTTMLAGVSVGFL